MSHGEDQAMLIDLVFLVVAILPLVAARRIQRHKHEADHKSLSGAVL